MLYILQWEVWISGVPYVDDMLYKELVSNKRVCLFSILMLLQQSGGVGGDGIHERADTCERAGPDPTWTVVSQLFYWLHWGTGFISVTV